MLTDSDAVTHARFTFLSGVDFAVKLMRVTGSGPTVLEASEDDASENGLNDATFVIVRSVSF